MKRLATPLVLARCYLVLLLIGVAGLGFGIQYLFTPKSVVLATETIPRLPPHEHEVGDAANDTGHGETIYSPVMILTQDIWADQVDIVVKGAPDSILHHLNLIDMGTSPSLGVPAVPTHEILAAGADTPSQVLVPRPYALFLPQGTRLRVSVMLHNALPPEGPGGTYENVSVALRLSSRETVFAEHRPVTSYLLVLADEATARDRTFQVPPRTTAFMKTAATSANADPTSLVFPEAGTLVLVGAHLHPVDGGKRIDTSVNGKPFLSFVPKATSDTGWNWKTEYATPVRHVEAGDTLTFTATYSNPYDEPERGVMGTLGVFFAPDPPEK